MSLSFSLLKSIKNIISINIYITKKEKTMHSGSDMAIGTMNNEELLSGPCTVSGY